MKTGKKRAEMHVWMMYCVLSITLVALFSGCAGRKAPPATDLGWKPAEEGIYLGSPLEGPQVLNSSVKAEGAVQVSIRMDSLPAAPPEAMEPLAAKAQLLTTMQGENPFLATATLTLPARYGEGVEAESLERAAREGSWGAAAKTGETSCLLPVGATAWLQVSRTVGAGERVRIGVYRPRGDATSVRVSLLMERQEAGGGARSREVALVRQAIGAEGQSVALLMPLAAQGGSVPSLLAFIRITPPSGESEKPLAASVQKMRQAGEDAAKARAITGPDSLDPAMVASIVEAMVLGEQRRPALVYFAGQTGAALGEQFAMVADAQSLEELSLQLADALGKEPGPWKRTDAGWLLDRLVFQRLAQGYTSRKLSAELRGVLAEYAGEAGRSPAALEEITQQFSTRKDFDNRLVAENVIALEDSSPAARVRAFDWLKARGRAPEGYDPLGSRRERREAIERFLQAMAGENEAQKGAVK